MSDTVIAAIVGAVAGIITGSIGSLFAPWANWGVEKRKQKLTQRRELISSWRAMIARLNEFSTMNTPIGRVPFGNLLIRQPDWPSLKAHLPSELIQDVNESWHLNDYANPDFGILGKLTDEIGRIEKRWKLV